MQISSLGAVGASVAGIDLRSVTEDEMAALRTAFADHGLLVFRDQSLTEDEHIGFAQAWGEININRFFSAVEGYPQIAQVLKEPGQEANIGGGWHTDHTYDDVPALGSMLYAREVPPHGGDTLFANTCAAYESLTDGLKQTLGGLRAVHSSRHVFGAEAARSGEFAGRFGNAEAAEQDAVHPVVVQHPLSGRPSLYVNPAFTLHFEGWSPAESLPLLQYLYQHIGQPQHTYRLQFSPGTLAFWDNRATWHWAVNDYHGHRRLMHRITLEGEALKCYAR